MSSTTSSSVRELEPCYLGKGCILRLFEDDSKSGSYEAKWSETTYDGAEDSDVLNVPVHWHAKHDEYVQVLEGRLTATINGKAIILDPNKGLITIPRYHTHGFKAFKGERVTAKEYTYPAGKYKEEFFRDMLEGGKLPGFWGIVRAFHSHDTYPSLGFQLIDRLFLSVFGGIAKLFGLGKPARERQ